MSKKQQQVVLLNIKNFGINKDTNSKDNLLKLVPFSNFKKLLGVLHSSQEIAFNEYGGAFRKELYEAFNLKSRNFLKLSNPSEKLDQVNEFLVKEDVSELNDLAHVFIHLDNEFDVNNSLILSSFLEKLQTFLDNQEYIKRKNFKFLLNIVASRALYDWNFLKATINRIQTNTDIRIIVNSITPSKHLLKNDFVLPIAEDYFNELFSKTHKNTFSSLNNLMLKIQRDDKIDQTWVNENSALWPIRDNDLMLVFSFKSKELQVFHSALAIQDIKTHIILLDFDKYNLRNTIDNEKHFLEDVQFQNTVISTPIRDSFLFGLFPNSQITDIVVDYKPNDYEYVFNLAQETLSALMIALKERKTDIITLNWNLFREVKEKFGPDIWLFSIILFDIFVPKIINRLNRRRIRWILFSTSHGFERMFKIEPTEKVSTLYMTNKLHTTDETQTVTMENFREILTTFLLDEKIKKSIPILRPGRSIRINSQLRRLSKVRTHDQLMDFVKKTYPSKFKNTEKAMKEIIRFDKNKTNLVIEKGVANLFSKKVVLSVENLMYGAYNEEKKLYAHGATTTTSDLSYFYSKVLAFHKHLTENNKSYTQSSAKPNSLPKMFYSRYMNHLNKQDKIAKRGDDIEIIEDIKPFRKGFKYFVNEFNNLKSIKYTHLNDLIENHEEHLKELRKKGVQKRQHNKEWAELYSKALNQENKQYKDVFDVKTGLSKEQLQEKDIIINEVKNTKSQKENK